MKRKVLWLLMAAILVVTAGCSKTVSGKAEDSAYPYSWQAKKGSFELAIDGSKAPGYNWEISTDNSDIVEFSETKTDKKGNVDMSANIKGSGIAKINAVCVGQDPADKIFSITMILDVNDELEVYVLDNIHKLLPGIGKSVDTVKAPYKWYSESLFSGERLIIEFTDNPEAENEWEYVITEGEMADITGPVYSDQSCSFWITMKEKGTSAFDIKCDKQGMMASFKIECDENGKIFVVENVDSEYEPVLSETEEVTEEETTEVAEEKVE